MESFLKAKRSPTTIQDPYIPLNGEICKEVDGTGYKHKMGDGKTPYNDLPYIIFTKDPEEDNLLKGLIPINYTPIKFEDCDSGVSFYGYPTEVGDGVLKYKKVNYNEKS